MTAQAVAVDTRIGPLVVQVTRANLVRYAGASLDFNPIHWNERMAREAGLPDVIAHGMYTMALGGRLLSQWAGDPAAVIEYGVRFTRPVVVPADGGATVEFTGTVTGIGDGPGAGRIAAVSITARHDGRTVLGKALAKVRLS